MIKVLITGFGRFPGAPANPSGPLALAVAATRRLPGIYIEARVLPTTWEVARGFPSLLDGATPDIVLMIGLASRRRQVSIELYGRNATGQFPDAGRRRPAGRPLHGGAPAMRRCTADPAPLLQALRLSGVPAQLSRNAGGYICNALAFRVYGWAGAADPARSAVFVHIPYPRPGSIAAARMRRGLEALLVALVAQHRRTGSIAAAARR